jgi:hypothetical protein
MAGGAAVGSADGSTTMFPSSFGAGARSGADDGDKEEGVMVFKPSVVSSSVSSSSSPSSCKDTKGGASPDGSPAALTSPSSSTGDGTYMSSHSSSIEGPGAGVGLATNSPNRSSSWSVMGSSFIASKMDLDLFEILFEFFECHGSLVACPIEKVQQRRRRSSVAKLLLIILVVVVGGAVAGCSWVASFFTRRVTWD